jgi:hypothetical protein
VALVNDEMAFAIFSATMWLISFFGAHSHLAQVADHQKDSESCALNLFSAASQKGDRARTTAGGDRRR